MASIYNGDKVARNGIAAVAQNANRAWSCTLGAHNIYRFELRSGDHWVENGPTKDRSEMKVNAPVFAFNTDYWIAHSFNIGINNTTDTNHAIVSQAHATADGGDIDASPPVEVSFRPSDGQLRITTRTSTDDPLLVNPSGTIQYFKNGFLRNVWHSIVHRVRFNTAGGALLQTWLDSVQVVNFTGSIGYVDVVGPYWKWGYYRPAAAYTGVVQHTPMEMGTASLFSRVNAPLPVRRYSSKRY